MAQQDSLAANSLAANSLAANSLAANSLAALRDPSPTGDLYRQLVQYTVSCALTPSQSFSFSYTDTSGTVQNVTYPGELGLAPQWASGPLTQRSAQQFVSACLAARTNYFGVVVQLSVRGLSSALATTSAELAGYPNVEGAFWGNLFAPVPALYACYNPATVAHSIADQRVCATGHVDANGQTDPCGMITLTGSCDTQCAWFDPWDKFYVACGAHDTLNAITTGLQ